MFRAATNRCFHKSLGMIDHDQYVATVNTAPLFVDILHNHDSLHS